MSGDECLLLTEKEPAWERDAAQMSRVATPKSPARSRGFSQGPEDAAKWGQLWAP